MRVSWKDRQETAMVRCDGKSPNADAIHCLSYFTCKSPPASAR